MALGTKRKSAGNNDQSASNAGEATAVPATPAPGFLATPPLFNAATMAGTEGAPAADAGAPVAADAADGTDATAEVVAADAPATGEPATGEPTSGDDVAELRSSLHDLQELVATLMARTDQPTVASDTLTRDSDTASRIIVAANHAAEATIEGARTEAEELITTAKAKSFEIIGVARDLADQELAAERERVARATADWATTRDGLTDRLVALEESMGGYQAELTAASDAVRAAIEQFRSAAAADETVAADATVVADESTDSTADAPVAEDTADAPAAEAPGDALAADVPAAAAPVAEDGAKRSNLFGGDAASRRPVDAPANGANGNADTGRLRAGFFGR